jgi:DNA-binding XRE family transcriptional regulator
MALCLRLDESLRAPLSRAARADRRSLTNYVELTLDAHVATLGFERPTVEEIDEAKLRERFVASGISQAALARQTGVSQPTLCRWARGERASRSTLTRIAAGLEQDEAARRSGAARVPRAASPGVADQVPGRVAAERSAERGGRAA